MMFPYFFFLLLRFQLVSLGLLIIVRVLTQRMHGEWMMDLTIGDVIAGVCISTWNTAR